MPARPFQRESTDEIDKIFRQCEDPITLSHIRDELRLRETRLAKALLRDVEMTLAGQETPIAGSVKGTVENNRYVAANSPQARAAQVKIAELRQRLLDLSNRNKLINFKHASKGGRQIRVVGEWLPKLYADMMLDGDKAVEFTALPPLPHEPEDEQQPEFTSALEVAFLTDKAYLKSVDKIENEPDDKAEFTLAKAKRAMQDRLRKQLGWPTRAEVFSMSIAEHAKRLGIDPSYELNNPTPRRLKRRIHQWQTLLTEDELERRMRGLEQQARESREEYGLETLYLIVGFLEWIEKTPGGQAETPNLSPLLLVPLSIQKKQAALQTRTVDKRLLIEDGEDLSNKHRDVYTLQGGADEVSLNLCLRERLRQDFGLELPEWDEEMGLEGFLGLVQQAIADRPGWKVRSYSTVSHLTFNRLAMWQDLDPEKSGVSPSHLHPLLCDLFGGGAKADQNSDTKHEADPEAGVPSLIMDCDSSQFAAIKSALSGRSLTIQGPPGTGKSQTIANLIASFLHEGKTVLFVAEKMAALNVVHSRLSKAGIGDFLLELHSAKVAKKIVLDSIRRRLDLRRRYGTEVSSIVVKRRKILRDKLNAYAAAMNSTVGSSGLSVHDLIWHSYEYRNKPIPDRLTGYQMAEVGAWDKDDIASRSEALERCVELEKKYRQERTGEEHPWYWVENSNLHVEECDQLYHHVSDLLAKIEELRAWLEKIDLINLPISYHELQILTSQLASLGSRPAETAAGLWEISTQSDIVRKAETVITAHQRRLAAERIFSEVAPIFLQARTADAAKLKALSELALKVIPQANGSTDLVRLEARKNDNVNLLTQSDLAIKLMVQLRTILAWKDDVGADELKAAAVFIELGVKAPNVIIAKCHNLGGDGQTSIVRSKLVEMEACAFRSAEINRKLKVHIENIEYPTAQKHCEELMKGGFFAFFRAPYREAKNYCRNVFPEVPKDQRLLFLGDLCGLVALRNRLGADETMREAAGTLFAGWDTAIQEVRDSCDWIDTVRERTPIINKHSGALRALLFGLSQDQASLAHKLKADSWPKIFLSLSDQCQRQSVGLRDFQTSIKADQDVIDMTVETMGLLEWQGELSHERLKSVEKACADRDEAIGAVDLYPSLLELLLPDPIEALACLRSIAEAHHRVRILCIKQAWRDRLIRSDSIADWADLQSCVSALNSRLDSIEQVAAKLASLAHSHSQHREKCARMPIGDWEAVLRAAAKAEKMVVTRAQLLASKAKVETFRLTKLIQGAQGLEMEQFDGIADLFRALYFKSMVFRALETHACLAEFRHESPSSMREKFSQLDHELKNIHLLELVHLLLDRKPAPGVSEGLIKERSELGLLQHVAKLEKPRTSVRDILRRAGHALQTLKPCFMMSPLSVAQLIEREKLSFDVVIFDEASQVRPEDAMSAMVRSRQFVVVGDQMQLPPTSFGEKTFREESLDDQDDGEVEESAAVESILELAGASYDNGRKLLWHYRSRDPSLIAFSNREFYRNELLLFPCPSEKNKATGVKYVWVGGHYSARTNADEAKICAQAAVEFMRQSPDRSLGIVALNRPQADLIQLELDRIIHENQEAADYQAKWADGLEPLFVKNLENVQGDERDVIFISTVFGDDVTGQFFQRFGPINSAVGHRRLNVLFTRAKFQLVLFTSLPTEKIKLTMSSHWGVKALKEYLDYARTGRIERGIVTGASEDSPFEVGVRMALETAGFQCEPQVGIAGFFVDLGVRHPRFPDHYLAGVECDGAAYHSTRSARDRDRLRQNVLESFGWNIYRIWSTDWFADPHGQLEKLVAYLEQLKITPIDAVNQHGFDYAARFGKSRTLSPLK